MPDTWSHFEAHDGSAPPEQFDLFWMGFEEAAMRLEASQGAFLSALTSHR